ncbi:MAG: formylmethanofuran dehydrogenase subunit A [Thermoproteota archaeon]|nr:MAG: formylmethanofuran dehydrogenase subunit A [Candidatus Korarchaeota archaeon]
MEIIIKGGYVYDPLNGVKGEKLDIGIKDGKIVDPSKLDERSAKVIDASGKVVMPGGVDLHSHIAGAKVNVGRLLRPEDHYVSFIKAITGVKRSGSGKTTPTVATIGYKYARMGWTTVIEPATPPLKTRHTHEELNDIPILDKACFPLVDSNWFVLDYLSKGEIEKCAAFIAWLLNALKGYALKLVDPGVAELWSLGKGYGLDFDDEIPSFGITPREIVTGLCKVNKMLKLPHSIHLHCNRLGIPGNYSTTLETMKALEGMGDGISVHVTHAQFNSYKGDNWPALRSAASEIADYVNGHRHVSIDIGQIMFGGATTMTADAPFEFALFHMTPIRKWAGSEVEVESASGIVPFKYKKKSIVNAVQWCIGLELALLIKDPWRVIPTTDHPNGGPFTRYPRLISWLMSKKAREEVLEKINKTALRRSVLPDIEREYTLYEIAISTRAAPAKLLGLENKKGHLGEGADADVAIYDLDPTKDLTDPEKIVKPFKYAYCTIKDGEIVVMNGKIAKTRYGRTFYVRSQELDKDLVEEVEKEIKQKFKEWYTVQFSNYIIDESEIRHPEPIVVGG